MRRIVTVLAATVLGTVLMPRAAAAQENPFSNCRPGFNSLRQDGAESQPVPDRPSAKRTTLTGGVVIICDDTTVYADSVTYDSDTKDIVATGSVLFQQRDLRLNAERAELNGITKNGKFFNAYGSARLADSKIEKSQFGTMEPDVFFEGELLEKIGPQRYRITKGSFTTCVQPTRRWEITGSTGTVEVNKRVLLKNAVLKVKDVPLFYVPVIYYPINKQDRSTGFLLPQYGNTTLHGTSISNAFFWAISRSQDATFSHDWFSKTGQAYGAAYRYVISPASNGNAGIHIINEHATKLADGTVTQPAHQSYRIEGTMGQTLKRNFRLSANAYYFTDASTQQQYQNISDASQRQRFYNAFLTGNVGRMRVNVNVNERDYFYGTTSATRTGSLPQASVSLGDKPIGKSRVYYGASGDMIYIVRQDDISNPLRDRSLWRFDGSPTIRAPISTLPYLTGSASASWRFTHWGESFDPLAQKQVSVPLNRQILEFDANLTGPVFSRVFTPKENNYAERYKHLIEPRLQLQRFTAFSELLRVVQNDYVDSIVGGTTQITYGLTNRLLVRRKGPPAAPGAPPIPGPTREILSVNINQRYYSNAAAAKFDPNYQSNDGHLQAPPGSYSPLQISANGRPTDNIQAQFTTEIDSKFRAFRTMNASGTVHATRFDLQAGWTKRFYVPGLQGFDDPRAQNHYMNAATIIRTFDNRLGVTYGMHYDIHNTTLVNQRAVVYYNSQCCGLTVDWQQLKTPLLNTPSDHRIGISFSLAGIGSFSNPMGSFSGR